MISDSPAPRTSNSGPNHWSRIVVHFQLEPESGVGIMDWQSGCRRGRLL